MGSWVGPIAAIGVMATRKISAVVRLETLYVKPVVCSFREFSKTNFLRDKINCFSDVIKKLF
jgi:hypothetical protein